MNLPGGQSLLFAALLVTCCGPADEHGRAHASDQPPNLILISLDTCRADRLSCYGAKRKNSPHLDRFATNSIRFTDCVAQSTVTAPSHLSLLTGHHVERHGLDRNRMFPVPPYTLATILGGAGWKTAAFTGHGPLQERSARVLGFDFLESWHGPPRPPFQRSLSEVLPRAFDWLDSAGRDPFFLFVHGFDPHCPYWPPEPFRERYAGWYDGPLDASDLCGVDFDDLFAAGRIGDEERRYLADLYDAQLASADQAIGIFLRRLEARGVLDRSIVVFTSDHGEVLGNHDEVGHGNMWEEEIRVPLLIRFPLGARAGSFDGPVQHVDLVPTLLSVLGIDAPEGLQGVDLSPFFGDSGRGVPEGRLRVCRTADLVSARTDGRWKLVFRRDRATGELRDHALYDLEADPLEARNLYGDPEGRERFEGLIPAYLEWIEENRELDSRLRGVSVDGAVEDRPMLEALGYTGD